MEDRGYFFIDGSHLFSCIYEIQRRKPEFKDKKLNIGLLREALQRKWSINIGTLVRVTYYFKQNDNRIRTMLVIPEAGTPGEKNHWQIKECGVSIGAIPDEELQKISPKYRDHFARAEKGLDIKLACDALLLVSTGRADNVVFLVNDRDYIPLFEAIQSLGGNIYLTALDSEQKIQNGLLEYADKYLTLDTDLENIFGIVRQPPQPGEQILQ